MRSRLQRTFVTWAPAATLIPNPLPLLSQTAGVTQAVCRNEVLIDVGSDNGVRRSSAVPDQHLRHTCSRQRHHTHLQQLPLQTGEWCVWGGVGESTMPAAFVVWPFTRRTGVGELY